ncbi:MAG: 2-succinyl-5-enolpyruvyl-6-hydroxy-3-cyclohexene-1-carboxylic-acid synthase [Ignavibacteria bacterium RIFOXYB2_FULL_35_12]|nr:MAG: 2-succinyl-5-enolpyruvyl-6-hydroxy-3-cyclohexene-1-carboxylic-acid synthase [Ignavibacteria bacterium RIFOXYB2_FULL_35_12]
MKKIKVNRNILWAETLVAEFVNAGVKYACISPGSRSTPLTYAFATNKKIKSFAIIDERSGGFFALGLAKAIIYPVVLVCTSGTAAAEFYPAIIEAYQNKIPLIVCTADRPPELQNVGANQTINQNNIYKNHIRWFADAGLPQVNKKRLNDIKNIARRAVVECSIKNVGPVHINFPFKEPFEPNSFTDEITQVELKIIRSISKISLNHDVGENPISKKTLQLISKKIKDNPKGIILIGLDSYAEGFFKECIKLSEQTGYPIFADAASNMRFSAHTNQNVLTSYDSYLRSEKFIKYHKPEFMIQFGRNFSSKALSNFIADCSSKKLLVNKFGDWNNPKDKSSSVAVCDPETFCRELSSLITHNAQQKNNKEWLNGFLEIEKAASKIKREIIETASFPNEIRIVSELIKAIPDGSNLMVSNSLPIRDLDLSVPLMKKRITIFHNRGASGIDGIISTALGIAQSSKRKTYLLTGDLAFYYDLNSLLTAKKYSIPLTIILINNNGGRIFEVLPISNYKKIFEKYFVTPHDLEFKVFIQAYGGNYKLVKNWQNFRRLLKQAANNNSFSVLELKTNAVESLSLRRKYFEKVISTYNHKSKKLF